MKAALELVGRAAELAEQGRSVAGAVEQADEVASELVVDLDGGGN